MKKLYGLLIVAIIIILVPGNGNAVVQFSNNASSLVADAGGISDVDTTVTVTNGDGVLFPSLTSPDFFMVTLVDSSGNREIVKVTARATDTFTIVRAQEGTAARAFAAGSIISNRVTAGTLDILAMFYPTNIKLLSDYSSLSAAVSSIGATETILEIDTNDTMAGNVVCPETLILRFNKGYTIDSNGNTLTIYAPESIIAPAIQKLFEDALTFTQGGRVFADWLGAVPDDTNYNGTGTNNATAIQNAIDSLQNVGGIIEFASVGWYDYATKLTFPVAAQPKKFIFKGQGGGIDAPSYAGGTVLYYTPADGTDALEVAGGGGTFGDVSFEAISFYGSGASSGDCIVITDNRAITYFRDVAIQNFDGGKAILATNSWNTDYFNVYIADCDYGFYLDTCSNSSFYGCKSKANNVSNLYITKSGGIGVFGGEWGFSQDKHIWLEQVTGSTFSGLYFEADANSDYVFYIDTAPTFTHSAGITIEGCVISMTDATNPTSIFELVAVKDITITGLNSALPSGKGDHVNVGTSSFDVSIDRTVFSGGLNKVVEAVGSYGVNWVPYTDANAVRGQVAFSMLNMFPGNIKGMWFFDALSGTTITDLSASDHDMTVTDIATNHTPGFQGNGSFIDFAGTNSEYWQVADHADFSQAGPFSVVVLCAPTFDGTENHIASKYDETTGSEAREFYFKIINTAKIFAFVYDENSNASLTAYDNTALANSGTWRCFVMTFDGGTSENNLHIYENGVQIDDTRSSNGAYANIQDTAALYASYQTLTSGSLSLTFRGRYGFNAYIAQELSAEEVKAVSNLLLGMVGEL